MWSVGIFSFFPQDINDKSIFTWSGLLETCLKHYKRMLHVYSLSGK